MVTVLTPGQAGVVDTIIEVNVVTFVASAEETASFVVDKVIEAIEVTFVASEKLPNFGLVVDLPTTALVDLELAAIRPTESVTQSKLYFENSQEKIASGHHFKKI